MEWDVGSTERTATSHPEGCKCSCGQLAFLDTSTEDASTSQAQVDDGEDVLLHTKRHRSQGEMFKYMYLQSQQNKLSTRDALSTATSCDK